MKYLNVELHKSAKKRIKNLNNLTILDDEIFDRVCSWNWYINVSGYVFCSANEYTPDIFLHRVVMDFYGKKIESGQHVDHINGNRRDNRLENLRICSVSENMRNRKKPVRNRSGYKGASFNKTYNKYSCAIVCEGNSYQLGYYDSPVFAGKVYDYVSEYLHGVYCKNNGFNVTDLECEVLVRTNNTSKISNRVLKTIEDIKNGKTKPAKTKKEKYKTDNDYLSLEKNRYVPIYEGTKIFSCKIKDNAIQLYNLIHLHKKGRTYNQIKLYKTIEEIFIEEQLGKENGEKTIKGKKIIEHLQHKFNIKLNISECFERNFNSSFLNRQRKQRKRTIKHKKYFVFEINGKFQVDLYHNTSKRTLGKFKDYDLANKIFNLCYYYLNNHFYDTKVSENLFELVNSKKANRIQENLRKLFNTERRNPNI